MRNCPVKKYTEMHKTRRTLRDNRQSEKTGTVRFFIDG